VLAEGARAALSLSGTVLGYYPVRVLPSKTAISPVNPTFLPRVRTTYYVGCCASLQMMNKFLLKRFSVLETEPLLALIMFFFSVLWCYYDC
jgi:hypothetical protein